MLLSLPRELIFYHVLPKLSLSGRLLYEVAISEKGELTWDDLQTISHNAAKNGYLNVLKYARANGCSWNEETCAIAAEGGHLEVLKYLHENGCPWDAYARVLARRYLQGEVIRYLDACECP